MSTERDSSSVRNLRSLFESKNNASESSPDARGRSPGLLGRRENTSPSPLPPRTSRIRASFVAVEPRFNMATTAAEGTSTPPTNIVDATTSELRRESSKGLRRASFSDNKDGVAAGALRETISTEQARRDEDSTVGETIPESAIESAAPTPLIEVDQQLGAAQVDKPAGNPDKPVTGAEEEPATIKPADPASEDAVSGGKALAPGAEDLRKPEVKKAAKTSPAVTRATANGNGKVSGIKTKDIPKSASNSLKSPASQPNTPLSPASSGTPTAQAGKKTSRASLAKPTAASEARAAAADKAAAAASKHAAAPKPKPREATKPLDVSSRLTAPTAASRAKHEPASAAPAIPKPTTSRPKTATSRPAPRQSMGRPESRGSQTSTRRPAPVDSSFLDRMTRPTAASSSKTHKVEKVEVKSPPKTSKQIPHRPKTNGHPKGVETASKGAVVEPAGDTTAIEEPSILSEEAPEQTLIEEEPVQDVAEEVLVEADPKPEVTESEAIPSADLKTPEKAVGIENSAPQTNGHDEPAAVPQTQEEASPAAKAVENVPS